ncbi:MAG: DUF393 domain-containing protein [Oligoflexia bacterium]|nr:DUF393 domain-containing protein [Oligoflexia bacterium]
MSAWNLKIFFDGACPMCSREIRFLMGRNKKGTLAFEDTSAPGFQPQAFGISSDPQRVIHAQLANGTIITGMEVFRRAYKEVGLGFLLAPTGWPIIKPVADICYSVFARYRKKIGKHLGSSCPLP